MYLNDAFRAFAFRKGAFEKLRKQRGLFYLLAFTALLTILFVPLAALVVSLNALFGGGGPLTQAMPNSVAGIVLILFVLYFIVFSALALLFVYALHLFSNAFGGRSSFREMLAAWSPALLPLCLALLPLFVVLVYGFFGGTMSDTTGTAIGVLFNVLLVALPIYALVYTLFAVRGAARLSFGKAAAATGAALVLFAMVSVSVYFLFAWLI